MKLFGKRAALVAMFALSAFAQSATAADNKLGRNLAATCANCHGTDGVSVAQVPSLAGVPAAVTIKKMKDYREGKLPASIMHQISKGFNEAQVAAIAEHFAKQSAK